MSLFLTPLIDNFNIANGALNSDWTAAPNNTANLTVVSSQAHSAGSTRIGDLYNIAIFNNTEVYALPISVNGTATFNWILFSRIQALTGSPAGYSMFMSGNVDRVTFARATLGASWSFANLATVIFKGGNITGTTDKLGFRTFEWSAGGLSGTRLEAWTNRSGAGWVLEGAYFDNDPSRPASGPGYIGMGGTYGGGTQGSALTFDDFSGGEFSVPSYPLADYSAFSGGKHDWETESGAGPFVPAPQQRVRRDRLSEKVYSFRDKGVALTVPAEQGGVGIF